MSCVSSVSLLIRRRHRRRRSGKKETRRVGAEGLERLVQVSRGLPRSGQRVVESLDVDRVELREQEADSNVGIADEDVGIRTQLVELHGLQRPSGVLAETLVLSDRRADLRSDAMDVARDPRRVELTDLAER